MATFVNNLRLKEINTGDESGTWGASTNTNLELIGSALGFGTKNMAADANVTLTMPDFSADGVRSMHLKITSVALTATREVTLGPNTVSKFWIVENATTGGQTITLKQGSGSTVSVPNGGSVAIYTEGTGAGAGVKDSLANINITGTGVFTNLTAASVDINGGTIDGAALGLSSAITALTLSGNLNVSGGRIKLDGSHPIGTGNSVLGEEAGNAFTGSNLYNVAIGYRALKNSTSGSGNVAVGSNALENNTVIGNMAFGTTALNLNTTGEYNTAVGLQSQAMNLVGSSNTSLGFHSLEANLSDNNVAIGVEALTASTTGRRNLAIGAHVLRATQTSSDIIGIGYKTLSQVLTGNSTIDFGNNQYLLSASNGSSTITVTMPDNLTAEMKNLKVGDSLKIFGNYQGGIGKPTLGGNIDAIVLSGSNTTFSNKLHTITSLIGGDTGNQFTFTATDGAGNPVLANASDTGDGEDGSGYNLQSTQYNNIAIGNFNMTAATSAAFNTVIGNRAGRSLTSGYWNTLIGHAAGEKITNDQRNTMIGQYAGNRNESSFNTYLGPFNAMNHTAANGQNIAIGAGAYGGQTGTQNINIGLSNMLAGGDFSRNMCIGYYAAYNLGADSTGTGTFDSDNTLVGFFAGGYLLNQDAVRNVAMGVNALKGDSSLNYIATPLGTGFNVKECVAIGCEAMSSPTGSNGDFATAVGFKALHVNNGTYNTAIGCEAGLTNSTGTFNTYVGAIAGKLANTTANTAVGFGALSGSNGGSGENTAIGGLTAGNLTTGSYNVANGAYALSANLTGNNNVSIGHRTLDAHLGSNCVAVGKDASTNVTTSDNTIAIGYNAQPSTNTVDNEITLGDANITALRCNVTTIASLSDIRDKSNVEDLPVGLDFINALNPVKFDWSRRDGSMEGAKDIGFIAQDLDSVQDEFNIADYANLVLKENPDKLEASYGKLVPVLVKAVQELSSEVARLKELL